MRWLPTLLVRFAAALSIGLAGLWPCSYWWGRSLAVPGDHGQAIVVVNRGELIYWRSSVYLAPFEVSDAKFMPATAAEIEAKLGKQFDLCLGGFAFGRVDRLSFIQPKHRVPGMLYHVLAEVRHTIVAVPIWFPMIVLAVPWAWRRWRRRSASRPGGFEVLTG